MKASKNLNAIALFVWIAALVAGTTSCDTKSPQTTEDAAEVATKENDVKFDNKKLEKDAQFLVDAAAFNMEEIRMGELARQKSNSADVQALCKMMIEEHTKTLKEVQALAKQKQVTVPDTITNHAQDDYAMLSSKTGDEFNKAYCEDLIESHKEAVASFEKISADSRDQDIKGFATTKLPDLRKHVDHIFECQKKLEKK